MVNISSWEIIMIYIIIMIMPFMVNISIQIHRDIECIYVIKNCLPAILKVRKNLNRHLY